MTDCQFESPPSILRHSIKKPSTAMSALTSARFTTLCTDLARSRGTSGDVGRRRETFISVASATAVKAVVTRFICVRVASHAVVLLCPLPPLRNADTKEKRRDKKARRLEIPSMKTSEIRNTFYFPGKMPAFSKMSNESALGKINEEKEIRASLSGQEFKGKAL